MRWLGRFWLTLIVVVGSAAAVLQYLGPPEPESARRPAIATDAPRTAPTMRPAPTAKSATVPAASPPGPATPSKSREIAPGAGAGREIPGPVASPDPALLEPSPAGENGDGLPKVGADGRMAMQVYARGFDRSSRRPRVAVILAGVGLNEADSEAAIRALPGEVTLAFSPYAAHVPRLAEIARASGHEFLASIPMEPTGYPLNDPGDRALLTAAPAEANRRNLDWALGRIAGAVGATGALGDMRGERFAGAPVAMGEVLSTLARRGLLYVDPRPGAAAPSGVWGRGVDLIIDEPAERAAIDARLSQLEQAARDHGAALGLISAVRPVTTDRLAAWARGLADRGFVLAPVSAIASPPPGGVAVR